MIECSSIVIKSVRTNKKAGFIYNVNHEIQEQLKNSLELLKMI